VGLGGLDPWTLGELGIGHQQMVEIARNLIGACRLLMLDEPTAMLTHREVELLFLQIERLKADGVSIIYIPTAWKNSSAWPTASPCCATASSSATTTSRATPPPTWSA
jgi:ABC-type Mn2+/Zn2+ transport system ATPase subunit